MEIMEVCISGPGASTAKITLQISPSDLFLELRAALNECPTLCFWTSYQFEYEGCICYDYQQIGEGRTNFKMVEVPYTYSSIRHHVQRFQDIMANPPKTLSVEMWLQDLIQGSIEEAQPSEVLCPFSVPAATAPEIVNGSPIRGVVIRQSVYDPPIGRRRLQGDLIYLDVETEERNIFHITGTQNGFYVNNSKDDKFDASCRSRSSHRSSTLAAVLSKGSNGFRLSLSALGSSSSNLHPLVQAVYHIRKQPSFSDALTSAVPTPTKFDNLKIERNWNDEYLVWHDQSADGVADGSLVKFRSQYKTYADFVSRAITGAVSVAIGEIPPLNANEPKNMHVYLCDNIFFSLAVDGRGVFANQGGDETAHKLASHDVHGCHLVGRLAISEDGQSRLHSLLSTVVDYAGIRIVCQAIIPGIMNDGGSTLLFGALDDSQAAASTGDVAPFIPTAHVQPTENSTFCDFAAILAKKLHWSSNTVHDLLGNPVNNVSLPMDCKGLSASDGRMYLMDLVRFTPRDANYPDNVACVLRLERVNRWCHDRALEAVLERSATKRNDTETSEASVVSIAEVEQESSAFTFNINALTAYEPDRNDSEDLNMLRKLSQSIIDEAIPAIVDDMKSLAISSIDGRAISSLLHSHGVNMRYLGRIYAYVKDKANINQPFLDTILECIRREILVRSAKHVLSHQLRSLGPSASLSTVIATFFNNLLLATGPSKAKSALWAQMAIETLQRFSYTLVEPTITSDPITVLFGICQAVGITVVSKQYDFSASGSGVSVDDLVELTPKPKFHLPEGMDTVSILASAKGRLSQGDQKGACEVLNQFVQIMCATTGPIHYDVAEALSMLSMISYRSNDAVSAIDQSYRVIVILERLFGSIDAESARAHSQHALFLMCGGFLKRALRHAVKASHICEILGGASHPDTATALLNCGIILMEMGKPQEAFSVQLDGLSRLEKSVGVDAIHLHLATAYHAIAFSHAVMRRFRDAIAFEKRSRSIAQKLEAEAIIGQCNSWLSVFTRGAVMEAKACDQQMTVKPTAAALAWIAAPSIAKTSSYSLMKEFVSFQPDREESSSSADHILTSADTVEPCNISHEKIAVDSPSVQPQLVQI